MLDRTPGSFLGRGRPLPPDAPKVNDPGDVTYLIAVVRRWRRLIGGFVLAGLAISLVYLLLATPQYRATARILIDFRRLADIGQDQFAINNRVNDAAVESQATIMTSEGVLRAVIRAEKLDEDPEFAEDGLALDRVLALAGLADPADATPSGRERRTIEALGRRLTAQRVGVSYVIELRFLSADAAKAARIANALAGAYVGDQLAAKREAAGSANGWYRDRVAELQAQAGEAEKAAVAYRASNRIMLADGKYVDEQLLTELSSRLVAVQGERSEAEAKRARIEAILDAGGGGAVADEFQNNLITALRQKAAEIRRRMAEITARSGGEHDAVERARQDLQATEASIADEFRRIAQGYRSTAAVARLNEQTITRDLEDLARRSAEAQGVRVQLAQLQSVADTYKSMRDSFLTRFAEAAQEQTFPVTEARIVSDASVPNRPATPNWYKAFAAGLSLSFGLGFVVALGRDVLTRRVRDRRQLEAAVGSPCIAVIADLPALAAPPAPGRNPIAEAARLPFSALAESLRAVRLTADARFEGAASGTVLGLVSAVSGDGVSTLAGNLATLLARSGSPTLLIDLDLRGRTLTRLTRETAAADAEAGLQDVLDGRVPITAIVRRQPSGLHVLPASTHADRLHPSERIAAPQLANLLEMARNGYRYVVLDLPPMLPVCDARAAAALVDGFVMVARWNETSLDDLHAAVALNPEVAAKLIGAIMNRADPDVLAVFDDTVLDRSLTYLRRARRQEREGAAGRAPRPEPQHASQTASHAGIETP